MNIESIPKTIGPYKILKSLGRGGMGEVLLAFDPSCERKIALKRIRPDLQEKKGIYERFLREVKIASKLTHPSIIPIYSISTDPKCTYYTMPYIEGDTLKDILKNAHDQEKEGKSTGAINSIPTLSRFFLNICEAMAYTHEKGYLHRDLKPENFIIGKYGEVMILDWGIADSIKNSLERKPPTNPKHIAGTVAYMAPERALQKPSTILTDIYALGTILYQILTLQLPFRRSSLAYFHKMVHKEKLMDPLEAAPYREIPPQLAEIAKKCLSYSEVNRYQSVQELISDLKKTIEGKSKWILLAELSIKNKEDWAFEENVFLTKHLAISKEPHYIEWVSLMVSKAAFAGNLRIEADLQFSFEDSSIGLLFNIPEILEKKSFEEGYNLWISPSKCQLLRKNLPVLEVRNFHQLNLNQAYRLKVEKIEHQVKCFINDKQILSYASHLPLVGTHIGLLYKDNSFQLQNLKVYSGSHAVKVNCLAVPDAFFTHKQYDTALQEYRRIGQAFPGRAEGRIALFRAGLTLLEKMQNTAKKTVKKTYFQQALEEFSNLYQTSGAPLEYLGKSIAYAAMEDNDNEAKCLELAIRKFSKHPLLFVLHQHLLYRIHESSLHNRLAAFRLILLALRHFPKILQDEENIQLVSSLEKNLVPLYFVMDSGDKILDLCVQLSFWVGRKHILVEMIENAILKKEPSYQLIENALFALIQLNCFSDATALVKRSKKSLIDLPNLPFIEIALGILNTPLKKLFEFFFDKVHKTLLPEQFRTLIFLLNKALENKDFDVIYRTKLSLAMFEISKKDELALDAIWIESFLMQTKWNRAEEIFQKYSLDELGQENFALFSLYGCYLAAKKGSKTAKNHFSNCLGSTFSPHSSFIAYHFLQNEENKLFLWEKKQLYRELALYYHCISDEKKKQLFEKKSKMKVTVR